MADIKKENETENQTSDYKIQEDEVTVNGQDAQEVGAETTTFPSLSSEDSGLGLSASTSEQQLPPGRNSSSSAAGDCNKAEDVWRKGGRMENMSKCIQDILASVITRCINTPYHIHLTLQIKDPVVKKN